MILIELTCPAEENIEAAKIFKRNRYEDLVNACKSRGWNTTLFTIEIGARGCVAYSVPFCLRKLGFTNRETKTIRNDLAEVAAKCSHEILLSHQTVNWDRLKPHLVPNKPMYQPVEPLINVPCDKGKPSSESPRGNKTKTLELTAFLDRSSE